MIYTDKIHLIADSKNELHEFALKLGIYRHWYDANPKHPHYDIPKKKLTAVLQQPNVKIISSKEIVLFFKNL